MIPREILKKIRQIEIRTNRIVTETLAGQYHSVFKGQGMNFEEVREYQPGDEVRSIDWNVTARMNHPFIKKFIEERELTLMLVVDVSGSGLFGSGEQSKRELAAEIASVLAFSAIRNNDKVGLILFTDEVEKFIPPRKGRRHVLRVIREILFHEPKRRGTDLNHALEFLTRVTPHRAIAVVVSDFLIDNTTPESKLRSSHSALRQANRRHDVVAVRITDRFELELPPLGRLVLEDAETGEVVEVNAGNARHRTAFAEQQTRSQAELARLFRSARIDAIQLRTDQPYAAALGRFFETRKTSSSRMNTNLSALIPSATNRSASPETNDLRAIKPPMAISSGYEWLWWTLGTIALVVVLILLARWLERRRQKQLIVPLIPAHERARRKLQEALDLYDQPKPFCILVSDAVRLYLEERFGLRAPERTTEEFLCDLGRSAALTEPQKASLEEFLSACDMVKFAKYEPQRPELEALFNSALRLIEETEPREVSATASKLQTPQPA